jgi:hypothetical protein
LVTRVVETLNFEEAWLALEAGICGKKMAPLELIDVLARDL